MPAGTSRYLDIAADLRTRILSGEWEPGTNLPRMTDLARRYGVNRDTLARAIAILEAEGLVWAVPRRGTIIRYGTVRPRRARGNLVKRNPATGTFGYSFPSSSGQEVWKHHVTPTARPESLTDARLARMLGVPEGTDVVRRFRVTGPETEPPFQISDTWIHPRGAAEVPETAGQAHGPSDWIYLLELAGHGPISWKETHRARVPTKKEADLLQIPVTLPVLEIVRVGTSAKDSQPIEITMYVIPSDRVEQVVILECDETANEGSPEVVPIVAAIVTSPLGVLVARRNDGKPPWTFIAGEIKPGENPANAAVREVREETGLRIRTTDVIGRRVHPHTAREMIYLAARPTHGTRVLVGDEQELAEVRWVDLAQADELMGGAMFESVRSYLEEALKAQDPE